MAEMIRAFRAAATRSLAQLGLSGAWVDASLGASVLTLADSAGSRIDLPFDAIDRGRFGYDTSRFGSRTYDMRLWTQRTRRPLLLRHIGGDSMPGYAQVGHGIAAAIAARRGIGAVEGGLSWAFAIVYAAFVLCILGYSAWVTVQGVREGDPLWFLLSFPAMVLLAAGAVGWGFVRLYCPRRLSRLDQLDAFVGGTERPQLP
jgi:hypothetical protein